MPLTRYLLFQIGFFEISIDMAGYEKFVKELEINFEWKINRDSKKLDYRDLTGPEKFLLFQH